MFVTALEQNIAVAGHPGTANTWRVRNNTDLTRLIITEPDEDLVARATRLQRAQP